MKERIKKYAPMMAVMLFTLAMGTMGFCDGTADSSVTGAFTTLAANVGATIAAVAAIAVGIMGTFLAWKYGRKLFNQVAK